MYENDNLLASVLDIEKPTNNSTLFIDFLNQLEGWKTKCKNLHWSAPKKNIHEYLDDFLNILISYQDGLAEEYQGILGKMQPNAIKGVQCDCLNALDFISEVRLKTISFYERLPKETIYKGIASECESFIHNINKFTYLFNLCDIKLY